MAAEIITTPDRLAIKNNCQDDTIYVYGNNRKDIVITNDISDNPDASSFFIVIEEDDWDEMKSFVDNHFKK